ncbi:MAG: hypothetical protein F4Y94_09975, partial [Chloroflexi bacterium]|nr:hypothetical protein [Chloroflexota bacterium]
MSGRAARGDASQLAVPLKRPDRTIASQVRLFVRYYPVGVAALGVLVALVIASALAPTIARFDPLEIDFT